MNFQRGRYREEPEINLVPLIDVMMVILIFLMITTSYSKYTELQINLPTANTDKQLERSNEVAVLVKTTVSGATPLIGPATKSAWTGSYTTM